MQILHAGRYAYHPLSVAPSAHALADHAVQAARADALGRAARRSPTTRAARALAQRAGYDGVEIMGSEGYLINEFVAPRTNHRDDEWGGAFENRIRFPVEIVRRTREAVGTELHHRLPAVDARPRRGRQHVGRGRRARAGGRGGGRDDHQHRHRLARGARADDRDDGAARGLRLGHPAAEGRRADSAGHHQPDQRPGRGRGGARARRRRHGVDGAPVPRRRRLRRQGGGGSRRRDQHVHRLQPGLPRPDLLAADRVVPRQSARVPRDEDRAEAGGAPEARSPSSARVRRASPARRRPPKPATRSRCSTPRREIGGQFNLARRIPGKEEFARDAALFPPHARAHGRANCGSTAASAPANLAGFDHVVLATGIVPRTPAIPGIDHPKVASYTDIVLGRRDGRAGASRSSAPAASASTSANSSRTRGGPDDTERRTAPSGGSTRSIASAAASSRPTERPLAARGLAAAAQGGQGRRRASRRPPAGSGARCSRSAA